MKRLLIMAICFITLSGCWSGQLKRIVVVDKDGYMTVGDTLYKARDLQGMPDIQEKHLPWQESEPQLSNYQDKRTYALLLHESEHSKQMKGMFRCAAFCISYNMSKDFRWKMESEAYRIEIETLVRLGAWNDATDIDDFAARISKNDHYKGMISYDDARRWVTETAKGGKP